MMLFSPADLHSGCWALLVLLELLVLRLHQLLLY
jgi:hypothetical protein